MASSFRRYPDIYPSTYGHRSLPNPHRRSPSDFYICRHYEACRQALAAKGFDLTNEAVFDSAFDRCFCGNCYEGDDVIVNPNSRFAPRPYNVPVGWCRFGIVPTGHYNHDDLEEAFEDWHRGFHGVPGVRQAQSVVEDGELLMHGDKASYKRQGRIPPRNSRSQEYGPRIWSSPCPDYASMYNDANDDDQYVRCHGTLKRISVVFQLLQHPNSYRTEFCDIYAMQDDTDTPLKRSTVQRGKTIVYGLCVRLDAA